MSAFPLSAEFFAELDRRIESKESPHPEDSKERLRRMRIQLQIMAAAEPDVLERRLAVILPAFFGNN